MGKRKVIWRAAAVCAVLCLVLLSCSCSKKDGADENTKAGGETKTETETKKDAAAAGKDKTDPAEGTREGAQGAQDTGTEQTSSQGTSIAGYVEPPTLYREEEGVLSIYNVSMRIPEGMELYDGSSTTIVYRNADADASFALYVEVTNEYGADVIIPLYVKSVQNSYGSQVVSEEKEYGGHTYTVMDIGSPEGQYAGSAAVLCEGSLIVYLEYVSEKDVEGAFEELMNSFTIE